MGRVFRAIILVALTILLQAHADPIFGTNTGTFAYWLPTYAMTDMPLSAWGTASDPSDPSSSVVSSTGALIANGGTISHGVNYPGGTYTISFNSPTAVTLTSTGMFSGVTNVTRNGTLETMNVTFTPSTNSNAYGALITSGVSSSNQLTNFQVIQNGQTSGQLTSTFQSYLNGYQSVRWMNNLGVNNNTTLQTSASLVPSGANMGINSYQDIVNWSNAQSNLKDVMIEIPVNADSTYIAAVAKTMSQLRPGITCIVEQANETWNYSYSQAGWLQGQGAADSRVIATSNFQQNAEEAGLRAAAMMQTFKANFTGSGSVAGFLDSQGGNTYYVDQEKAAINRIYGSSAVSSLFKYQGISFYPGDGLTSASSVSGLYASLESDLTRVSGYLKNDASDAAASGLSECVYEWSPNGYLTLGDVSATVISGFRANALSAQFTLDTWTAIKNNIGPNGVAFDFDVTGDGWSTQADPMAATEEEQLAINLISSQLPEPASICLLLGVTSLAMRRPCRRRFVLRGHGR